MIRNALIIHYSFYKNTAVFLAQVWFALFSGFSGQTLYDDWIMTFFNIVFTSWPPIAIAVFETDISHRVIDANPHVYSRVQSNRVFTIWTLFGWFLSAFYHSLVIFFGAYFLWMNGLQDPWGRDSGFFMMGQTVMMVGILVVFLKLFFHVNNWNWLVHVTVWGSLLLYLIFIVAENGTLYFFPHQFFVVFHMSTMPSVYCWVVVGAVICLLPDFLFAYVQRTFFPEAWQILQEEDRFFKKKPVTYRRSYYGSLGGIASDTQESIPPAPIQSEEEKAWSLHKPNRNRGSLEEPLLANNQASLGD